MAPPILAVDDNPLNLKLVFVTLASAGFEVRTATDAEEALRVLESFQPAVILMDLQLPGMDGLELTRRIKADPRHVGVVVIAVTAYAMKGDAERALAAGCDAYVTKPIDTRTLPDFVARFLADKHAGDMPDRSGGPGAQGSP